MHRLKAALEELRDAERSGQSVSRSKIDAVASTAVKVVHDGDDKAVRHAARELKAFVMDSRPDKCLASFYAIDASMNREVKKHSTKKLAHALEERMPELMKTRFSKLHSKERAQVAKALAKWRDKGLFSARDIELWGRAAGAKLPTATSSSGSSDTTTTTTTTTTTAAAATTTTAATEGAGVSSGHTLEPAPAPALAIGNIEATKHDGPADREGPVPKSATEPVAGTVDGSSNGAGADEVRTGSSSGWGKFAKGASSTSHASAAPGGANTWQSAAAAPPPQAQPPTAGAPMVPSSGGWASIAAGRKRGATADAPAPMPSGAWPGSAPRGVPNPAKRQFPPDEYR